MHPKRGLSYTAATLIVLIALLFIILFTFKSNIFAGKPSTIKVGILHSLTGTMSISESPVADAALLAIEEINKSGGILGRKIEPVIADGRSDPDVFRAEAERLISKEHVKAIFGCWTSSIRKSVKPIVENHRSLLFYPVQYEGLEASPNIVYLGAAPNQQLIPAVKWSLDNLGKKFFLVGSDYVFPRVANQIARDVLGYVGGEVSGEEYAALGSNDFTEITEKIKASGADVILNTINGDGNIAFFKALREAGVSFDKTSVMSLSVDENIVRSCPEAAGTYACWNYFENIDSSENRSFVEKFKRRFGDKCSVNDPMEAAYFGVYLWSQAVSESKDTDDPNNILHHLYQITVPAPEGILGITGNNHTIKTIRIGRVGGGGNFDIIWMSDGPTEPDPYPGFRRKAYWTNLLDQLYKDWGGHWAAEAVQAGPER